MIEVEALFATIVLCTITVPTRLFDKPPPRNATLSTTVLFSIVTRPLTEFPKAAFVPESLFESVLFLIVRSSSL